MGAAHLLPGKFPAHKKELLQLVIAYYVLTALSTMFSWVLTQDAFLHTQADKAQGWPAMKVGLHLPKYSTKLQLRIKAAGRCVT